MVTQDPNSGQTQLLQPTPAAAGMNGFLGSVTASSSRAATPHYLATIQGDKSTRLWYKGCARQCPKQLA
jgi:hypothetical protein